MKRIIVFDFDKTLTYKDSLKELFLAKMRGWRFPLRTFYCFLALLSKTGLISVRKEKEIMIRLLFNSDNGEFEKECRSQAKTIRLTPVYEKVVQHVKKRDRVIVLSASSEYLLSEVFKDLEVEVIGTTLFRDGNRILSIDRHPFSGEKLKLMNERGIDGIDEMYYDSVKDECLVPLCKQWHKVKDGVIVNNDSIE